MMGKLQRSLDSVAIAYLIMILLCSLFSGFILSGFGLNPDIQLAEANLSPFVSSKHIFGTDYLGRDVFALLINGAKYSLSISIFSALLGTAIGVLFGAMGGFFGDDKLRASRATILAVVLVTPFIIHYSSLAADLEKPNAVLWIIFSVLAALSIGKLFTVMLKKVLILRVSHPLPMDFLNLKFIEILFAVPTYFVLLALSGIFEPSVYSLIIIIGITSWPKTSLLIRNEMLKIRSQDFIHALKLAGIPWYQILVRHAIPNTISPVLVNFVFFATGLLVVESTLSFVGIGLPGDIISWGKILAGFKHNSANWWTALFPGIVIFITILSFHRIGRMAKERM